MISRRLLYIITLLCIAPSIANVEGREPTVSAYFEPDSIGIGDHTLVIVWSRYDADELSPR